MAINPKIKIQLLALIDRQIASHLEQFELVQKKYESNDCISHEEQQFSEQFNYKFDRLHLFRDEVEADTAVPEVVSLYIDMLIDQHTTE